MKKSIFSGILFCSILLVGCNTTEVLESEQEVVVSQRYGGDDGISNLISELQNEIIVSITEQTELDSESIAISLGGNFKEMSVSVSFPKDVKVDDTLIQQIVEDSIKKVSETETVSISEEKMKIKIKIEKY
ncbi:topoisomerase [Sporosarcina sp. E16_3]|uniref:topoisomerase n=1 Tax=Sporosarcina sp. E16_3 TaxID=2789293 RepID=UPI001A925A76|nr:topoisomerase [Sporosarcina sp. E16_3]MBO0602223.1 topoisomerase [Sporosarcina sp. E16_3]